MSARRSSTLSGHVQNRLNLLTASIRRVSTARCLLRITLAGLVCLLLVGSLDFIWPLAPSARGIFALALIAVTILSFIRNQWSLRSIGPYDSVVHVEQAHPEFGQQLRTAWQYRARDTESSAAPKLIDALIKSTNARSEDMTFDGIASRGRLLPLSGMILGVFVLVLGLLTVIPETRITLGRLLLAPVHYSQVHLQPQTEPIMAGSSVTIEAEITGRPVSSVELWVREAVGDARWKPIAMRPASTPDEQPESDVERESTADEAVHGKVIAELADCQHDLQFKVVGGPVVTKLHELKVLQPLNQVSFDATVTPPAYTEREETRIADTALSVPEGSAVKLQLTLSRPAASAQLTHIGRDHQDGEPAIGVRIEGSQLQVDLAQVDDSQQFEFTAKAEDGVAFRSERIRLRVDKDHEPVVRFRQPEEQMEATPTTEVALAIDVTDDHGLGKIGVEYQIGNGQKRVLWQTDLAGERAAIQHVPVLFLENHELNHGDAITYYAFAEDNRVQPRRASSELRFIDIRPYKREFQIVDGSCSGGGGGCLTLEELIARQRQNLRRTFAHADGPDVRNELANRFARTQQEIREATTEFTTGWEAKFGPVPELHQASASMEQAETMLRDKQLPSGLLNEQAALNSLIGARQNLRQFLKNGNSSGLSQCRRYDSQMAQKLRAPERKETNPPTSQPPVVQPQLQKLAKQQREWSDELEMHSSGGAQLDKKATTASQSAASKPQTSQTPSKSLDELAKSQQNNSTGAQQLQEFMRQGENSSELSQQRMDAIAEQIRESVASLEQDRVDNAIQQARRAAEMAEQLNEHLDGLHAADFSQRLGVAEQIARRVAHGESVLSQELDKPLTTNEESMADVQDELAGQVATLGEVLKYLEADASLDYPQMRRDLTTLQERHPSGPLAREMRAAAAQIRGGRPEEAGQAARSISRELTQIAGRLGEIRRQFLQPRLDELMAAESAAAQILKDLKNSSDPATQARLSKQMGQLQEALRALNVNVSATSGHAHGGSRNAQESEHSPSVGEFRSAGDSAVWGHPTLGDHDGLSQIIQVLQQKIQDAILLSAQMDADQPVPPVYRRIVEEYYQALSDDLR